MTDLDALDHWASMDTTTLENIASNLPRAHAWAHTAVSRYLQKREPDVPINPYRRRALAKLFWEKRRRERNTRSREYPL